MYTPRRSSDGKVVCEVCGGRPRFGWAYGSDPFRRLLVGRKGACLRFPGFGAFGSSSQSGKLSAMSVDGLFSGQDPQGKNAGEFSGVDGIIQPAPHDPFGDASESNMLLMAQDRDDIAEQIEALKPRQ